MRNKLPEADQPGRFHQTIIRYDDEPVYVRVEESETFTLNGLHQASTFKNKKVSYNDPKIDISTPPLGWVNGYYDHSYPHTATYIERVPTRQYKQGLCGQNVRGYHFSEGNADLLTRSSASAARDWLFTKGYEECVKGVYPSLDEALKAIKKGSTAVALSKNIALKPSKDVIKVFFKTSEVGWFDPSSRVVKVPKEQDAWIISKYLSELDWKVE